MDSLLLIPEASFSKESKGRKKKREQGKRMKRKKDDPDTGFISDTIGETEM